MDRNKEVEFGIDQRDQEKQVTQEEKVAQRLKRLPAMWETWVRSLGWEDPLEKGTATHSSILAWRLPWTVQSMGHKE